MNAVLNLSNGAFQATKKIAALILKKQKNARMKLYK